MKLRIGLIATVLVGLATCAVPTFGQIPPPPVATSGTLAASNAVVTLGLSGQATCAADVSGTWSGTITFQVIGQSQNAQSATAFTYGGASQGTTTTGNGIFAWASGGTGTCQVKMTSYVSGTANITMQAVPGSTVTLSENAITGTVTVSCAAAANCPVNDNQVTTPWVVSTPTSAPLPTASTGAAPPAQSVQVQAAALCNGINAGQALPAVGNQFEVLCSALNGFLLTNALEVGPGLSAVISGLNSGVVDSSGNRSIKVCKPATTTCASVTATSSYNTMAAGLFPATETKLSAVVTTCTAIVTGAAVLQSVMYASSAAQTGTLAIYNEGAAPTCTASDIIYTSATHAATGTADVPNFFASAGLAYEWTTNAEVQNVFAGWF